MKYVMTLIAAAFVASPAAAAMDGAKLYAEKTCNACHGAKADKPLMPNYPKLAGQNAAYLQRQLRVGERTSFHASVAKGNGQTAAMKGVMHLVNDEEIKAIADWLSKQK